VVGAADAPYRVEIAESPAAWTPLLTAAAGDPGPHLDGSARQSRGRLYRAVQVDDPDALPGDHIATSEGDVLVHPLYHASFLLQWNGLTIYSDPDSPADYTGLSGADMILISHGHGDHFDETAIARVLQTNTVILAPSAVHATMNPTVRARATIMSNGDIQQVHGITIRAVPAYNANHPVGAGNGYLMDIGDTTFYISGDTGPTAEMRALQDVDVAFLCMNIPFTMTVDQAASAVRDFQPDVLYPYHYRNSDGTFADLERLKSLLGDDIGTEVRVRDWY